MRGSRILLGVALVWLAACSQSGMDPQDTPIETAADHPTVDTAQAAALDTLIIRFGSSFGECAGYCWYECELRPSELRRLRRAWQIGEGDTIDYPTQRQVLLVSPARYAQVLAALDTTAFWKMPTRIGCPDCSDGGACWIELEVNGRTRRIDYDCHEDLGAIGGFEQQVGDLDALFAWSDPDDLLQRTIQ